MTNSGWLPEDLWEEIFELGLTGMRGFCTQRRRERTFKDIRSVQRHGGMEKHDKDLGNSVKLLVSEWRSPLQEWTVRPGYWTKKCVFFLQWPGI